MTSNITQAPIVDDAVFIELAESLGGPAGSAHLERLLVNFADTSRSTLDALAPAVLADHGDEVARLAHTLRGGSVMVGAARLAQLAEVLESSAKAGDLAWAPELLTDLDEALAVTCAALSATLPR